MTIFISLNTTNSSELVITGCWHKDPYVEMLLSRAKTFGPLLFQLGNFMVYLGNFDWSPWLQLSKRTLWWTGKSRLLLQLQIEFLFPGSILVPSLQKFSPFRRFVGQNSNDSSSAFDDPLEEPALKVAGSHLGAATISVSWGSPVQAKKCRPIPEQQVPPLLHEVPCYL